MKIEITKAQLQAIKNMKDDIEAMIGCGEDDDIQWKKNIRIVNSMLKKNKEVVDKNLVYQKIEKRSMFI